MPQPLIHKKLLLEKYPGKGGWTYARVPEVKPDKKSPFGWLRVKGTIDGFPIKKYHLMPMKGGELFLPVKSCYTEDYKKATRRLRRGDPLYR